MEFGTRRAHEFDAAIWGTRAAYIAGFDATSNVRAGKKSSVFRLLEHMPIHWFKHIEMSTKHFTNMLVDIKIARFW
ncbi:hypothetical protein GCM10020331_056180 [Ectobacillus funiculus]